MNIHFSSNCQGDGLRKFMERSPDAATLNISVTQEHQIILGETTREVEAKYLREADAVFYHAHLGKLPWPESTELKPGVCPVALPVFYNGGYFIHWASDKHWDAIYELAHQVGDNEAVRYAVNEADMGYEPRWVDNLQKMRQKELDECVPDWGWISHWVTEGHRWRQNMTMNHPTSRIFYEWANILLKYLGLAKISESLIAACIADPNMAGLPCEETVCTAARKALKMQWGGSSREDALAAEYVRYRLNQMREARHANA